ncbi:MAG TPA: N-acetyltransferase [Syntrophomonas sp.]|jgi:putative acetyltransferase|nr:N-acetyltransferase [Syntrophomonas sp.]
MLIRKETSEEFSQIYDLVKIAFQTAKVSNGKEQDFVSELRGSGNYIPELALVAEDSGKLIGHIMLTTTYIANNNNKFEALLLAPVSVALEYRNRGVGSSLIKKGFELAREKGYTAVLLVGDPAYYHRFGFKSAVSFGIKHTQNIPDEYVMACELVPDAFKTISGIIECC